MFLILFVILLLVVARWLFGVPCFRRANPPAAVVRDNFHYRALLPAQNDCLKQLALLILPEPARETGSGSFFAQKRGLHAPETRRRTRLAAVLDSAYSSV